MRAILNLPHRATYADYLACEQNSDRRHEFLDGVIVAMAGGSEEHNTIGGRFAVALGTRIPRGCRYVTSDQRFWIEAAAHARYSDGAVICGASQRLPHDKDAIINPSIVVEVLSPSSAGTDDGAKRLDYQSLASLQAYVIAAQDERMIKVYRRAEINGRAGWTLDGYRNGQSFTLPGLTSAIAVAEIYEDILDDAGRSLLG